MLDFLLLTAARNRGWTAPLRAAYRTRIAVKCLLG